MSTPSIEIETEDYSSPENELRQAFLRLAKGMQKNGKLSDETLRKYEAMIKERK
ncbi:MAG: hypothetical protein QM537_01155 [Candidatus Symbiobacter sp.]|nr:hypothetical protein [Candidatus Symbiobacter sp.]